MTGITCLSQEARELFAEAMSVLGESPARLQEVPECPGGDLVGFGTAGRGGAKTKRSGPPSKYNQFVSGCMKGKGIKDRGGATNAMKECAAEWQRNKQR